MKTKTEVTGSEYKTFLNDCKEKLSRNQYNNVISYHDLSGDKDPDESWVACSEFGYDNITRYYLFK